jgi:hypothetical protein
LTGLGSVLLVGWGGEAYREALARCSPGLVFSAVNPFLGQSLPEGEMYGAVLLSGVLASAKRGEVDRVLLQATMALKRNGLLAFHDGFLPAGVTPSAEASLGAMVRRVTRGGCRDWPMERVRDSLGRLGLTDVRSEALPAGTFLVTARKT